MQVNDFHLHVKGHCLKGVFNHFLVVHWNIGYKWVKMLYVFTIKITSEFLKILYINNFSTLLSCKANQIFVKKESVRITFREKFLERSFL